MKRSNAITASVLITVSVLFAQSLYAAGSKGKHLFILSGQSNMQRFNHTSFFVPLIEAEFGKENVIIVKDAHGGMPISCWYKAYKGKVRKNKGIYYDTLMEGVRPAIKGQEIATVTFLWMQGEADAKPAMATLYKESLLGLYKQLSDDLGRKDIFFVIGRLSDYNLNPESKSKFPEWETVKKAQEEVAASDPKFEIVNTDDCNDGETKGEIIENGLHYSGEGYKLFGKRLAESAIKLINAKK